MHELLIYALILFPCELPLPASAPPQFLAALKDVNERWQLCSRSSCYSTDFYCEYRWTRRVFWELLSAPPLSDCEYLPPAYQAAAAENYWHDRARALALQSRQCLWKSAALEDGIRAAKSAERYWSLVGSAHGTDCEACSDRRRALARLRELHDYRQP